LQATVEKLNKTTGLYNCIDLQTEIKCNGIIPAGSIGQHENKIIKGASGNVIYQKQQLTLTGAC
jgi:hypothetical protein